MDVVFNTTLCVDQCIERLQQAIDPIPAWHERAASAHKTTWSLRPLRAAGQRTTGFGYAPGTRPVVGTVTEHHFHLEKKVVPFERGRIPIVHAVCKGEFIALERGTDLSITIQNPVRARGRCLMSLLIVPLGLFCCVTLPVLLQVVFGINGVGNGSPALDRQDVFPLFCLPAVFFVGIVALILGERAAIQQEQEYLLSFLQQVCDAHPLDPGAQEALL